MTPIDILPCVLEDGNVRRPYPGEATQFYGAYQKDADGLSTHIVDFFCICSDTEIHNRYTAVFLPDVSLEESDGTFPYVAMGPRGVYYHSKMSQCCLNAVLGGANLDIEHIVAYESLPEWVQYKIRDECLGYIDQPVAA
jgi:hypothetical protein